MRIEDIPDYPALQQLGRALWKMGKARGAAIFVGAGFTQNADRVSFATTQRLQYFTIAQSVRISRSPHLEQPHQSSPQPGARLPH